MRAKEIVISLLFITISLHLSVGRCCY